MRPPLLARRRPRYLDCPVFATQRCGRKRDYVDIVLEALLLLFRIEFALLALSLVCLAVELAGLRTAALDPE